MSATETPRKRQLWIGGLIIGSMVGTVVLLPPLHYLPDVKRAAVDSFFQLPPGSNTPFIRTRNWRSR